MAKLDKRLQEIRNPYIILMYKQEVSAKDIGEIFTLTTSAVYEIVKDYKQLVENN